MEVSKIHLSDSELELVQNAGIILTKNSVLNKMKMLLEELQEKQMEYINESQLKGHELFFISPKISRGENYLGLPWLILDHPRISNTEGMFFIRNMFWWGKFFSSTLHVSGRYQQEAAEHISRSRHELRDHYIGIHPDPWNHHFEEDNYLPVSSFNETGFRKACSSAGHLKIASQWPIIKWKEAPGELFNKWKQLLKLGGSIA